MDACPAFACPPVPGEELLSQYRPGMPFFFASPRGTLLIPDDGGCEPLPPQSLSRLLPTLRHRLQQAPVGARIVGAIPFDRQEGVRLWLAHAPSLGLPLVEPCPTQPLVNQALTHHSVPSADAFEAAVGQATAALRQGPVQKVVLGRQLQIETQQPVDQAALLRHLVHSHGKGYRFALALAADEAPVTLLGASPELLIACHQGQFEALPLAGTLPRGADEQEDARQAQRLLASRKDQQEHALMIQGIREALQALGCQTWIPEGPQLIPTPHLWHLATPIRGHLPAAQLGVLDLLQQLHPTPAVGGYPTEAALALMSRLEPEPRGLFTGAVGWCDAQGNGEWAVTIRCAQVQANRATLYAGAGVVADSEPAAERRETAAKFQTLLRALGLAGWTEGLA